MVLDGMGTTLKNLAELYDISREDQDKFAYYLNNKAYKAQKSGRFSEEIIPISIPQKKKDIPFYLNMMSLLKEIHQLKFYQNSELAFKKDGNCNCWKCIRFK